MHIVNIKKGFKDIELILKIKMMIINEGKFFVQQKIKKDVQLMNLMN